MLVLELILVLLNLFLYFRSYTCITELIHVFKSYACLTEHILVLRILFMCEGTRRYDKSEQSLIISHARSDQTYADTFQIWTLVHSIYGSEQIHIPGLYRFRTYPKTNRVVGSYQSHL